MNQALVDELLEVHQHFRNQAITEHPAATLTLAYAQSMAAQKPDFLTVKEAASELKVSLGAIYAMCDENTLPHTRIGSDRGTIRIARADLKKLWRARRGPGRPRAA